MGITREILLTAYAFVRGALWFAGIFVLVIFAFTFGEYLKHDPGRGK